jgi:hypothetical protein
MSGTGTRILLSILKTIREIGYEPQKIVRNITHTIAETNGKTIDS